MFLTRVGQKYHHTWWPSPNIHNSLIKPNRTYLTSTEFNCHPKKWPNYWINYSVHFFAGTNKSFLPFFSPPLNTSLNLFKLVIYLFLAPLSLVISFLHSLVQYLFSKSFLLEVILSLLIYLHKVFLGLYLYLLYDHLSLVLCLFSVFLNLVLYLL